MRPIYIAALLALISAATAYPQRPAPVCTPPTQEAQDSFGEVILTVCNHTRGMAPHPQPRLYFRLYSSGRVEYESPPEYDFTTGIVEHRLVVKHTSIEAREVEEILRLGRAEDFLSSSPVYPRLTMWTDSSLETTLVFKHGGVEKKVLVNNFTPRDTRNESYYPASLLMMLNNVWRLRPPDYVPSVRDLLINQPDFIATEYFTSSFMGHGFSTTYKTAKRFDCYRHQTATQIIYSCMNRPNVTYYTETREYREEPPLANGAVRAVFISDAQSFARTMKNVEYREAGTAMIGEQSCLKIEARITAGGGPYGQEGTVYVFYVAKNLNNLVIGVDAAGGRKLASSRMANVRLDFPDSMFQKPRGYRPKRP